MQRVAAGCLAIVLLSGIFFVGLAVATYGGLVRSAQAVDAQWGRVVEVSSQMENLAGNAKVPVEKRKIDPRQAPLESETMRRFQTAHDSLYSALSAAHRDPDDLRARFEELKKSDETERKRFNELVNGYNAKVRRFPTILVAGMMGFVPKPMFAEAGSL